MQTENFYCFFFAWYVLRTIVAALLKTKDIEKRKGIFHNGANDRER